jgi:hypothetical protein
LGEREYVPKNINVGGVVFQARVIDENSRGDVGAGVFAPDSVEQVVIKIEALTPAPGTPVEVK